MELHQQKSLALVRWRAFSKHPKPSQWGLWLVPWDFYWDTRNEIEEELRLDGHSFAVEEGYNHNLPGFMMVYISDKRKIMELKLTYGGH